MISALWTALVRRESFERFDVQGGSYLVADDLACLLVEEDWDGETTSVVWVVGKVDIAQVGEVLVQGVGNGVLARQVLVGSDEAPS